MCCCPQCHAPFCVPLRARSVALCAANCSDSALVNWENAALLLGTETGSWEGIGGPWALEWLSLHPRWAGYPLFGVTALATAAKTPPYAGGGDG